MWRHLLSRSLRAAWAAWVWHRGHLFSDKKGQIIPPSVHEGSATVSGAQGDSEHILLSMDAGKYNVQKAVCRLYCKTCNGSVEAFITANPWATPVSSSVGVRFISQSNTGAQRDYTSPASWTSGNTAIATVSAGQIAGQEAGATEVSVNFGGIPLYTSDCYTEVPVYPVDTGGQPDAGGTVQVPPR